MDLLHHLEKGKEELLPLQYHIKSLHIISRHYKKSLLRSPIYLGYEELSMDTSYPIWRRQERRSKYAVQLASWQLRSNSPKTSVRPASCVRSVAPTVLVGSISYLLYILSSNFRRCVACKVSCKISKFEFLVVFIPPPNEVGGGVYWIHLVRLSVCPSVRPSVRLSVDDMVSGA